MTVPLAEHFQMATSPLCLRRFSRVALYETIRCVFGLYTARSLARRCPTFRSTSWERLVQLLLAVAWALTLDYDQSLILDK